MKKIGIVFSGLVSILALSYAAVSGYNSQSSSSTNYIKPSDTELKQLLTPLQYSVTQHEDTVHPFDNTNWNDSREGIYVDVVSGKPLFSPTQIQVRYWLTKFLQTTGSL